MAKNEYECFDKIKKLVSYLPQNNAEDPTIIETSDDPNRIDTNLVNILPENPYQQYDMKEIIKSIVDNGDFFEIHELFAENIIVGFARMAGRTIGLIANQPMYLAGALDINSSNKTARFIRFCDSFNIPIVMFVDTPGFVIGTEAEKRKAPGKIMNMMNALSLTTVPKLSVILRKSYGQAYLNMGGGRNSDEVAAWPTAEVSFMDSTFAVKIVHGFDPGDPGYDEAFARMSRDSEVWDMASVYAVQSVIRPEETRDYLIRMLDVHRLRLTNGVGQHMMRAWPTSY